jgi:hypothetical protein
LYSTVSINPHGSPWCPRFTPVTALQLIFLFQRDSFAFSPTLQRGNDRRPSSEAFTRLWRRYTNLRLGRPDCPSAQCDQHVVVDYLDPL